MFPTSHHTRKAKNLRKRPQATAMIDQSRAGRDHAALDQHGKWHPRRLARGYEGGLEQDAVAAYLSDGDDVAVRLAIERASSWNLADRPAGIALRADGMAHPLA